MNEEEIKEKDKENKAIKFYKNFIEAQEKELDWLEKEDEEYYKDEIEEKQLLIKGFKTIQKLIENQKAEIEKKDKRLNRQFKLLQKKDKEITCLKCLLNTQVEIIDLMANRFAEEGFYSEHCQTLIDNDICPDDCNKCIKQYFENKAEESK